MKAAHRNISRVLTLASVVLASLASVACPRNTEDALMLHLYHLLHPEIQKAAKGTDFSPEYIAAADQHRIVAAGQSRQRTFRTECVPQNYWL